MAAHKDSFWVAGVYCQRPDLPIANGSVQFRKRALAILAAKQSRVGAGQQTLRILCMGGQGAHIAIGRERIQVLSLAPIPSGGQATNNHPLNTLMVPPVIFSVPCVMKTLS